MISEQYETPINTSGVVVLSAKEFILNTNGSVDYTAPGNKENENRIDLAIEVIRKIVSKKASQDIANISIDDIIREASPLLLSGTTEQLEHLRAIATSDNFPDEKIITIDCGASGVRKYKNTI